MASAVIKTISLLFIVLSLVHVWYFGSCETADHLADFYTYTVLDISGNSVSLEEYRGKVSLVVNVASQCGYTSNHYQGLASLQEHFASTHKFNVLAFPCNQFGNQEPGTNKDIMEFAKHRMGANFPLFAKVNVQGPEVSPAWRFLITHSGRVPTWNFWKYLVDHNGRVLKAWGPSTSPDQLYPDIREAISSIEQAQDSFSYDNQRDTSKDEF
ncbi:hypothetical protein BsWGS_03132 [Bradybaena similaris]